MPDPDEPDQNPVLSELTITATAHAVHPEGADVPEHGTEGPEHEESP